MKKLILLFLLIFNNSFAQNQNEELFSKANSLYKNGNHQEAINLYEQLTNDNLVSSELYFNLGNCYYKLNKVAPSIYNYEKALKLNPKNEDAQNNLVFANRLTLDRIETLPETIFQKINSSYLKKIALNTWSYFSIVLTLLLTLFFLLFHYAYNPIYKRLFFILSSISLLLFVITFSISFNQYSAQKNNKEAIIFVTETSIQSEPTTNANEAFVLHEGTKVFIIDKVDSWLKIKLIDGKIGWILSEKLKEL